MKDEKTSATLDTIGSSTDLARLADVERMLLTGEADDASFTVVDDPAEAERQIIAQLLAAETDDELEGDTAIGWREMVGVPVEILSFKYLRSTFKSSNPNYVANPVYFVVFANRVSDGSRVILTTGSKGVCAQLVNLAKRGRIPGCIRILTADEREGGNTIYRLVSTQREKDERAAARTANTTDAA